MEIFASICLIIVIVIAFMLVNRNVPDIKNNSEIFVDEQKHSDGGLSDSWEQLCVSNGIFDESEIEDV